MKLNEDSRRQSSMKVWDVARNENPLNTPLTDSELSTRVNPWQGRDNRWSYNAQNMTPFVKKKHAKHMLLEL